MSGRAQLAAWLIGLLLVVLAMHAVSSILLPFVAGMAVAYFLDPATDRLEAVGLGRTAATLVVLSLFFLGGTLIAVLLIPVLQDQFLNFIARLPAYISLFRETVQPLIVGVIDRIGLEGSNDFREAMAGFAGDVLGYIGQLLKQAWSGGLALVNLVSLLFITPIVAFYLLRDWDKIVALVDDLLPRQQADTVRQVVRDIDEVMAGFVRGQGTVCLILGSFYALALTLSGLDFGLVIGLLAGLVSFIPFVGAIVGLILSLVPAITQFWPDYFHIGIIVGIFVAGQIMEGNFLTPRLLGDRIGLHPVWVMFALLAGGALAGFVGVLLAVPVAAATGVLVRFAAARYRASTLYLGADGAGAADSDSDQDAA